MTESKLFRDKLTKLAKELSLRNKVTTLFPFSHLQFYKQLITYG